MGNQKLLQGLGQFKEGSGTQAVISRIILVTTNNIDRNRQIIRSIRGSEAGASQKIC